MVGAGRREKIKKKKKEKGKQGEFKRREGGERINYRQVRLMVTGNTSTIWPNGCLRLAEWAWWRKTINTTIGPSTLRKYVPLPLPLSLALPPSHSFLRIFTLRIRKENYNPNRHLSLFLPQISPLATPVPSRPLPLRCPSFPLFFALLCYSPSTLPPLSLLSPSTLTPPF